MLAPLSWLKEYIDIKLPPKKLGDKLTEVGLSTEKILDSNNDKIFEFEITPNRPDLLSIIGIAREIAAVQHTHIKYPKLVSDLHNIKPKKNLPLTIKTNAKINPRFSGIIIDGITVKESPQWLQERLIKMGQRPINNLVDITNYVMLELGNPLHTFDYDKIAGQTMTVDEAKDGEKFVSVDGIKYHLPKGAVVIRDKEKIIDLCGIKGGENTGTYETTKTIFLRAPVEVPILIRRTGQLLGLRSEASSIFERGVNAGGTIEALQRATDWILELAGGIIASELYDIKEKDFDPWPLQLRLDRLNFVLGIEIPKEKVLTILESLNLTPKLSGGTITVTVPTYRNDLQIEEDLIEEIARIYGYNNFPKTLPGGDIPVQQIPYFKDYELDEQIKHVLTAGSFSEIFTYSLISEQDLQTLSINSEDALRVDNPVSKEFEYLRPTLKGNVLKALQQNKPNFSEINLFELGKIYKGKTLDEAKDEYSLAGISNKKSYFEIKGLLERLFKECNVKAEPVQYTELLNEGVYFEIPYKLFADAKQTPQKFVPLPKYPPIIEDMAFVLSGNVTVGEIIDVIKHQSPLIKEVSMFDKYETSRTFRIIYQDPERNLTSEDVTPVREKIPKTLKETFNLRQK